MIRTVNGGHSWRQSSIKLPELGLGPLRPIYLTFTSTSVGWLEVTPVFGRDSTPAPDLLVTHDGGSSWRMVSTDTTTSWKSGLAMWGVLHFTDPKSGWVLVTEPSGVTLLMATKDDGYAWTAASRPAYGCSQPMVFAVLPLTQNLIFTSCGTEVRSISSSSLTSLGSDLSVWRPGRPLSGVAIASMLNSRRGLAWLWIPAQSGTIENRSPGSGTLLSTDNAGATWAHPNVGSDRGALPASRQVGFPGPPSEPDVRLSPHPALHVLCRWCG
ncbi:MAG: hypothetical protein HKL82_02815 [Acidimicrobiaceae bacterium]|nr:hypothetical protein [Acidimicrobiaceae bacterium]